VLEKLFEKMLHRRLEWFVALNRILPNSQAGFRKGRNTVNNAIQLEAAARIAIDSGEIMIAVSVDFESAFDHVCKYRICQVLKGMDFPDGVIKFLFNYLSDRSYKVRVQTELSSISTLHIGLPQGSILSPLLFSLVLSKLQFSSDSISKLKFADDLVLWSAGRDVNIISNSNRLALYKLATFSAAFSLPISKSKTNAIIFHNKKSVIPPKSFLNNVELEYVVAPKFLGVYLDPRLTWQNQANCLKNLCMQRLLILKRLAGSKWANSQKILFGFYKRFICSKIEYAIEAYGECSKTNLAKLETIQNTASEIALGLHAQCPSNKVKHSTVLPSILERQKYADHQILHQETSYRS
jgi:hypothetical protein